LYTCYYRVCYLECEELDEVNGAYSFTNGQYSDSVAKLVCNSGFELIGGLSEVICTDNGWSGSAECQSQ